MNNEISRRWNAKDKTFITDFGKNETTMSDKDLLHSADFWGLKQDDVLHSLRRVLFELVEIQEATDRKNE